MAQKSRIGSGYPVTGQEIALCLILQGVMLTVKLATEIKFYCLNQRQGLDS